MACFIVPAAEACVVTVVEKIEEKKALKEVSEDTVTEGAVEVSSISFSRKLKWLTSLLWGGAFLLAFEHVWHGEVVAWFPFLTAMADPTEKAEMLHEMATTGVCMAALITVAWVLICLTADSIVKRSAGVAAKSR